MCMLKQAQASRKAYTHTNLLPVYYAGQDYSVFAEKSMK